MAKKKLKNKKLASIGGWLLAIIVVLVLSWLSAARLLYERISLFVTKGTVSYGVHISMFLLAVYCVFLGYSLYLILKKRKIAIKTSIISLVIGLVFSLWYYIIGRFIFFSSQQQFIASGFVSFFTNLIIAVAIIFYLKTSKRIKNTLVK